MKIPAVTMIVLAFAGASVSALEDTPKSSSAVESAQNASSEAQAPAAEASSSPEPKSFPLEVTVDPKPAETHYVLGDSSLKNADPIGAIEEFRDALRLQPDYLQAHLGLGNAQYQMGNLEGAIESYRTAIRLQPDHAQAHLTLATALLAKHDWAAARDELQTAIRLQPDLIQAHYSLGVVRQAMGHPHGAMEAYRQALALKPDYADAHYNLGVVLKAMNRESEAAAEFLAAAVAGVPKAQFLLGQAYATGRGVGRNLALALQWWFRAAEHDVLQARVLLAQLRRSALRGKASSGQTRAIMQAFAEFRRELWKEFPDLTPQSPDDSVGAALLQNGQWSAAIPVLILEAWALGEPAQALLERVYEQGVDSQMQPHDGRILAYFKAAAEEGLPRARLALARAYVRGLGVEPDLAKAKSLLRGNLDGESKELMKEITAVKSNSQPLKRLKPEPKSP
jgi:Tfp pilus assembly protein PilF